MSERFQCPSCGEIPIVGACPHGCDDHPTTHEVSHAQYGNDVACDNCGDEWSELDDDELCPDCAEVKRNYKIPK